MGQESDEVVLEEINDTEKQTKQEEMEVSSAASN